MYWKICIKYLLHRATQVAGQATSDLSHYIFGGAACIKSWFIASPLRPLSRPDDAAKYSWKLNRPARVIIFDNRRLIYVTIC